ncbi:MAG: ParB/RepB/Spo0J family partition protein [Tissierellia bacterium]|nr:ParB/RepB/Spo0J family partition protein [Tissierellia bacterium]
MAKKGGLGKGLEALLSNTLGEESPRVEQLSLDHIRPNPSQPRKDFDEERLQALAQSIKEHGILQPIVVRRVPGGYEIVAGERRYRASREAGLREIPALIKDIDAPLQAKLAMVENLQRENLNSVEEAMGYAKLQEEHSLNQGELAELVGKSRVHITNTLRLLGLSPEILGFIKEDKLTAGHGRALLMFPEEKREAIAALAIEKSLSVRSLEGMSKLKKPIRPKASKDPHIKDMEEKLSHSLGTKVTILQGKRAGTLEISFYNKEDLEMIIKKLL